MCSERKYVKYVSGGGGDYVLNQGADNPLYATAAYIRAPLIS